MKRLAILRHAKSSWDDPRLDDFDRPLNARGRDAAEKVGREWARRGLLFDGVVASPAARARETLELAAIAYGRPLTPRFETQLYMAGRQTLLDVVRALPDDADSTLLVGHNPGLHRLVLDLTGEDQHGHRSRVVAKFPTGAFALVALPAKTWAEVRWGTGTVEDLILPRDLP